MLLLRRPSQQTPGFVDSENPTRTLSQLNRHRAEQSGIRYSSIHVGEKPDPLT
jgi:hypothetical protein